MPSSMRPRAFPLPSQGRTGLATALSTVALLSACGPELPKFAPACPRTAILLDGADLTQFRGGGTDLTDMVADGRITGLAGKCSLDDLTHLRTTLSVNLELTRGPAAAGARDQVVTYFVAVSRGDTILDKKDYPLQVSFPRNSDRLRLSGEQVDLVLPVDDKLSGAAYSVLVGFQLTPEQLAFNRRRGPR